MASRRKEQQRAMSRATSYQAWYEAALELDRDEGLEDWRHDDLSHDYDCELIRARLERLRHKRSQEDVQYLMHHLRQGLHWNIGNTSNTNLYGIARTGTKKLIESYLIEVCAALDYLCDNDFPGLSAADRLRFFEDTALSFGRSALMLSGGATLGLFHVGVVKALFEQDLLPKVLSGSSAGSLVASTIGTRSESEARELLQSEVFYHKFMERLPWRAAMTQGAVMDVKQLRHVLEQILGDVTFEQAWQRSGRTINITVSPTSRNQVPRLLNYLTFPYLYVVDAVMASCALPYLFPPVQLATQEVDGSRSIYMPSLRWVDGTLKSDLPHLRLRRLHNVNHFIVSQTNPHVVPFMQAQRAVRKGLLARGADLLSITAKRQAASLTEVARTLTPAVLGRDKLSNLHSILDQDYRGNITIVPPFRLRDYWGLFTNPTPKMVDALILEGQRATWPKIPMIRNQMRISQTLDRCLQRLRTRAERGGANDAEYLPRSESARRLA